MPWTAPVTCRWKGLQTATTQEITRGVAEAATGDNTQVIGQIGGAVDELARMSADLRRRVDVLTDA